MSKKRVVIAGMGFGGLRAAKALAGSGFELLLVDRNNYHLFQPLLYQVATAGLEEEEIAYPLRGLVRGWKDTTFLLAEIIGINVADRTIRTDSEVISYDYLIIAAGSRTNYFGMDSVAKNAFDLKRLDQAEDLRNQILFMFERAERESDVRRREALLTFVIVGGGPTGVEFAGALRELIVYVLSKDHPTIASSETRIIIVEAANSLLTAMPDDLREYARLKLISMGVEVMLESKVIGATEESVQLFGGTTIGTHTLLWSAGVAAADLAGAIPGIERGGAGRIVVQPDLTIPGHPNVMVIGDMACCLTNGAPLPMMAPVASQQGEYAAQSIVARERGASLPAFRYRDKGAMATIGKSSAVAVTGGFKFRGYIAWLAWLLLHLFYLVGFRNRVVVMMNWTYAYWFQERQVRIITSKNRRSVRS